jgi:hypothetical protein
MKYSINATNLTPHEARSMCKTLAATRYLARCECEPDVGYVCKECARLRTAPYELGELIDEYGDWLFTWIARENKQ